MYHMHDAREALDTITRARKDMWCLLQDWALVFIFSVSASHLLITISVEPRCAPNCGAQFLSGAQLSFAPLFAYQIEVCCHCVWPPLPHINPQ